MDNEVWTYEELQKRAMKKTDKVNALVKRAAEIMHEVSAGCRKDGVREVSEIFDEIIKEGNDEEAKKIRAMQEEILRKDVAARKNSMKS